MANETPLEVTFDSESGRDNPRIKSWSIESDYLTSTDSFEFTMITDGTDERELQGLEGLPVTLKVGGAVQLVGRIDDTIRGDNGANCITCQGRDYIADLVECNIDPQFTIKEKETLGSVILRACSPIGITKLAEQSDVATMLDVRQGIPGRTRTRNPQDNRSKNFKEASLDDLKPDIGQGIYEFLKPVCDRHGCTIQSALARDTLLIAGPFYEQHPGFGIVRLKSGDDTGNNVKTASVRRSFSSYPTHIIVQGQGAPRTGEITAKSAVVIDTWAEAKHYGGELARILDHITWSGRRKPGDRAPLTIEKIYRLNVFRDDRAKNQKQIENAARRLLSEHLKKSLEYKVTLHGHIDPTTGALWTHDTIVSVTDEICDISEELWVQSRRFAYSENEGPTTELVMIRPGSFEI